LHLRRRANLSNNQLLIIGGFVVLSRKFASPKLAAKILGARSEQRVVDILNTAQVVFGEQGFDRGTTADIARRLNISEATIFTYFGSKRELCQELLHTWYTMITAQMEESFPHTEGLRVQIDYVVTRHLDYLLQDTKGFCALILSEGRAMHGEFAEDLAELKRRYLSSFMIALRNAQAAGELDADIRLSAVRDMLFGMMEHILWRSIESNCVPDIPAISAEVTRLVMKAVAPDGDDLRRLRKFHDDVVASIKQIDQ
jgi:AcrR family transcriptional regulator